jgi:hypothetical protein
MYLSWVKISAISKRTKTSFHLSHVGVPLGPSKMIPEPMVCSVQIMHLSCTDTNTVSKRTETRFDVTHVTLELHRVRPKWFPSLWYVQRTPCTYLASRLALYLVDRNELPLEPRHLGVPSGASKMISDPMVCLAQTMHLSCSNTNAISERTETRFHLSRIT